MSRAIASVSIGRSRLPPELIRWLATSGIIVTSEPVRDRIVAVDALHVGGHEIDQAVDRGLTADFRTGRRRPRDILHSEDAEHRNAMVTRQVRSACIAATSGSAEPRR